MKTVISWSGGIPSTGLVAGSIAGLLPKVDAVIFNDPGNETASTMQTIAEWTPYVEQAGIEVLRTGPFDILGDNRQEGRWASLPVYTLNDNGSVGRLKRQCTHEYKIEPAQKEMRRWLGYQPRQRIPEKSIVQWFGYTREEITRIKPSRVKWITFEFPWIDMGWFRFNVENWLSEFCEQTGLSFPKPSACKICPFRDDWHLMPPDEQAEAIQFDGDIRTVKRYNKLNNPIFLHRSCLPLDEVIEKMKGDNHKAEPLQQAFSFECDSGYCGL